MQEWRGKYARAGATRTSPMIDGPVIFALGRTMLELFLPAPIAALCLWRFGFPGLLVPVALFFVMPRARAWLGHNRLLHLCWGLGAVRTMRLVRWVSSLSGARAGREVPSLFTDGRLKRFGP